MAETVYLAPGDEIASIKEKLGRAKGNPIILFAPKTVTSLRNPVTLKLVKRYGEFLGKDVILVAQDRLVRYLASYQGLPAYSSLTQVRHWKPKDSEQEIPDGRALPPYKQKTTVSSTGIAVGFLSFIVIVLPIMAGYLFFPSATVSLYSATQTLSDTVAITGNTDAKAVDLSTGTIPARIVEAYSEINDQTEIAGKKSTPDASATGQVTFVNKVDNKVTIPKGTIVAARSGVKFRTTDDVTITTTKGSSVRVAIIADQPGKAGNVDKWAIDQIPDQQLSAQVTVANDNPTQGGTDKEVGAVTAQDRTRLETQATDKAKNDVLQKLLAAKTASESIYPQTLSVQIVDQQYDHKVGDETKSLSVKLLVKGNAVAFEARDVNSVVANAIDKKMPKGMKVSQDGIKIKPLGAEKWTDHTVSFSAQADAKGVTAFDENQVKQQIAGMSKVAAENFLIEHLPLADQPEVRIEPSWAQTVPRFTWRIKLIQRTP